VRLELVGEGAGDFDAFDLVQLGELEVELGAALCSRDGAFGSGDGHDRARRRREVNVSVRSWRVIMRSPIEAALSQPGCQLPPLWLALIGR
jgi:hypothetical protein